MNTNRTESIAAVNAPRRAVILLAREPESPWDAMGFTDLVPPATLVEARARRDDLARLLRREREAAADFLLALSDFDRRRGWERLGHASLFAFLNRELGLSNGAAWSRASAARLLPRHPAVERALRSGQLCLSAAGELARVLTRENEAEVLPRFLGCSFREAREVVASILPHPNPPRRDVVRILSADGGRRSDAPSLLPGAPGKPSRDATEPLTGPRVAARQASAAQAGTLELPAVAAPPTVTSRPADATAASRQPPNATALRAHEVGDTHPARGRDDDVVPLTAELRRLSVTVSARLLEKLARARAGLSHAMPRATTEQVLEAALDLLLEQQARRKALVGRPRKTTSTSAPHPTSAPASTSIPTPVPNSAPNPILAPSPKSSPSPTSSPSLISAPAQALARPPIPAAVEREVRLRDDDRCQWPLDSGGVCGSTWQVELDHLVPVALGGPSTASNLRCTCRVHNHRAAALALGDAILAARPRRR